MGKFKFNFNVKKADVSEDKRVSSITYPKTTESVSEERYEAQKEIKEVKPKKKKKISEEPVVNRNIWVYDIETFLNAFTFVGYNVDTKEYIIFIICDDLNINDYDKLIIWLKRNPNLVGFNSLKFDAQVIQHMYNGKIRTADEIYSFAQSIIERLREDRWDSEYPEWKLTHKHLDLMALNHYGIATAKTTSLKYLEFTMRMKSIQDLPFGHDVMITRQNQLDDLVKYNKKDVIATTKFYEINSEAIDLRRGLYHEYKEARITSMAEPSIATYMLKEILSKELGIKKSDMKNLKTNRNKIEIGPLLRDYIEFDTKEFQSVHEYFKNNTINAVEGEIKLKGDILAFSTDFQGIRYDYGAGGLHACIESGVYSADDDYTIIDCDFSSYYPWLIITGNTYPEHLSEKFCGVLESIYSERKKHKKGTIKNKALKIVLNSIYGLFNNKYSIVYDPKCTVETTVNGQLILTMLCEKISHLGQILQVNTDGVSIKVLRSDVDKLKEICKSFEEFTQMELEYVEYSKMILRDVNNYIAVGVDGDVKRKGFFETYQDIEKQNGYHKNPSGSIIQEALSKYFIDGVSPEKTIREHDNIHDFCYAVKKQKNFEYIFFDCDDSIIQGFKKLNERVVRYYISDKGSNMYKHFIDGRKNSHQVVMKGQLVKPLMNIRKQEIFKTDKEKGEERMRYNDINYDWYIDETNKWIAQIEK